MVRMDHDSVNARAAWIAASSPVMDAVAETVRSEIVASASRHSDSGEYASSFEVDDDFYRSIRDRVVFTEHRAAAAIEFGHRTKSGRSVPGQMNVANVYHAHPKFHGS